MAGFKTLAALMLCGVLLTGPIPAHAQQGRPQPSKDAIGSVATVKSPASVARGTGSSALKKGDEIKKGDRLQTGPGGSLGITFDDETTFSLTSNAAIVVDDFVYKKGAPKNSAVFNVTRGTVGFVAAQVAKTGDMRITTPTATLGIRGTTGVVEVPAGAPTNVKLYPDANGAVGRIEIFGRNGARLGELTRAATGLAIQLAAQRLIAVPLQISPEQLLRDRNLVRQLFSWQGIGRQLINQRLNIRNLDPRNLPGVPQIPTIPGLPSIPGLPRLP